MQLFYRIRFFTYFFIKRFISGVLPLVLTVLLLFNMGIPAFAAEGQTIDNTRISITAENLSLKSVFNIIEQKTSLIIGYDNTIDVKKQISLHVKNETVGQVLKQLMQGYKGTISQVDDHHVIIRVEKIPVAPKAPVKTEQVQIKITGTVVDDKNEVLPGVSVYEKSSHLGTATDAEGKFSINVDAGATLVFSFIGYDSQHVVVKDQAVINVKLLPSANMLKEVVAIGYQQVRKSDVTGAISSVKASELNLSAPTIGQALVGKVAGVQVTQTSGAPYAGVKIRVRGVGSINASSDPLYVIDGYPAGNNIFINPEDIETIDILKDAASAAIYGSRGAGGVVLITTKKGKNGKGKFEYDVQSGFSNLAKKIHLLDATQFEQLVIDARNNSYHDLVVNGGKTWNDAMYSDNNATRTALVGNGSSVSIPTDIYNFATQSLIAPKYNTDWQDVLYRNAPFQRHNLSFSGGTNDVKYFISGGYQDQNGIVTNTAMKTVNFRANIEANVNDRMKVGANIAYTQTGDKETQEGRFSPMMSALLYIPYLPAKDASGNPIQYGQDALANQYGFQGIENPLATVEQMKITRQGYRSTYNAFATYDLAKGLTFKANLGTQVYNEKYDYYLPTSLSNGGGNGPYSVASIAAANAQAQTLTQVDRLAEFTLNYNKSIGKNNFNILGGYSAQKTTSDLLSVKATGFTSDNIQEVSAKGADASYFTLNSAAKSAYTLLSYFGRASYNYDGKYFLSGTLRTDGSSRFGPSNKWGTFPSVSAGWSLSQENWYHDFLGEQSTVKIRASWGLSGNNNIGNYNTQQTINAPTGAVFGSGAVSSAVYAGTIKDANLGWESTSQYNLGTDISILKNRLSFTVNYYLSRSYNLLFNQPISSISGSSTILTNLRNSKIQNKGLDFQVDATIIKNNDFRLGASANISFNRNKVLNLGGASTIYTSGAERSYITNVTEQGQPVGMFYGYQVAGRITAANLGKVPVSSASSNPTKVGDLYFQDLNGDGIINDKDKQVIGSPYAKFTGGFALTASYKSFDFNASFNGSYGNKILDGQDYYLYNFEGSGNQYVQVADRYVSASQPGGGLNYRASRAGTQSNSTRLSSFYIQNGSYLRNTATTLGYTIPGSLAKRLRVEKIKIYAAVDNAFTITKYKGYNPDVDYNVNATNSTTGTSAANLAPGVDYGGYPLARTYSLGLKVTF
ncbi:SusC/RagA family TonB-linked outer membrane protein [Mucilaginibacter sp. FT3.2]|uniref:SusC/RagA family TonB-linked outer membrane protein n=1 Tax=Mucilaginibacter sp. FT3.2 TaxID=2723090 RepID=UPI001622E420|nr:SusC/RagA family TonB-linked outer membrane protein [Mucilaginibacter sp. FT3.2]MBB6231498.1 TonB-linked SusC/RagA family outer membrane protein [Mucilaginibacter sp. FT3.2]